MWLQEAKRTLHAPPEKPIRSFRAWRIWQHNDNDPYLGSVYVPYSSWGSGPNKACDRHGGNAASQSSPFWEITYMGGTATNMTFKATPALVVDGISGYYGVKKLGDLTTRLWEHDSETPVNTLALGHCLHWGYVVEHLDGYRSEYATVARLYLQPHHREFGTKLTEFYGCPVSVRKFPEQTA